jgi:hypothetical protein
MVNLLCSLSGVTSSDAEDISSGTNGNIYSYNPLSEDFVDISFYNMFGIQFLKE